MYPSLFPFLSQRLDNSSQGVSNGVNRLNHLGSLERQDNALKENARQYDVTNAFAEEKNAFEQRGKGGELLAKYGGLIALGTKDGRDAARAMLPQLQLMGVPVNEIPGVPDEGGFTPAAPAAPAVPGAKPDEFHDAGIQKNIAALNDDGTPTPEKPAPAFTPPKTSGYETPSLGGVTKRPSKALPMSEREGNRAELEGAMAGKPVVDPRASMGEEPSLQDVMDSNQRVRDIGGTPAAAPEPQNAVPGAPPPAPPEDPASLRAQAEARLAGIGVDTRQIAPVAPPLMRGGLPVMGQAGPLPSSNVNYRGDYHSGKERVAENLGTIDPNAADRRNTAQTANDQAAFKAGFPEKFGALAEGAVKGSKSPQDAAAKGEQERGTIEKMIGAEAAMKAAQGKAAAAAHGGEKDEDIAIVRGRTLMNQVSENKTLQTGKTQELMDSLIKGEELLKDPQRNGLFDAAVQYNLARELNGAGVLTQTDVDAVFKGTPVFEQISNWISGKESGTLTPETLNKLLVLVQSKKELARKKQESNYAAQVRAFKDTSAHGSRGLKAGMRAVLDFQFGKGMYADFYNPEELDAIQFGTEKVGATDKPSTPTPAKPVPKTTFSVGDPSK